MSNWDGSKLDSRDAEAWQESIDRNRLDKEVTQLLEAIGKFVEEGQPLHWHALIHPDLDKEITAGEWVLEVLKKVRDRQ